MVRSADGVSPFMVGDRRTDLARAGAEVPDETRRAHARFNRHLLQVVAVTIDDGTVADLVDDEMAHLRAFFHPAFVAFG